MRKILWNPDSNALISDAPPHVLARTVSAPASTGTVTTVVLTVSAFASTGTVTTVVLTVGASASTGTVTTVVSTVGASASTGTVTTVVPTTRTVAIKYQRSEHKHRQHQNNETRGLNAAVKIQPTSKLLYCLYILKTVNKLWLSY